MKEYIPNPIVTDDISLPIELQNLLEQIAENVHEVWASGRIAEGWKYGNEHNQKLKTHPCIVPYHLLPESEKEYDRNTALTSLKLIYKLGFKIEKL